MVADKERAGARRLRAGIVKEERKTVCPLDCPDSCGMVATVEDGRIVSLRGDRDHPFTRGFICRKMRRYIERVYTEDRLLYPQVRTGAKGRRPILADRLGRGLGYPDDQTGRGGEPPWRRGGAALFLCRQHGGGQPLCRPCFFIASGPCGWMRPSASPPPAPPGPGIAARHREARRRWRSMPSLSSPGASTSR